MAGMNIAAYRDWAIEKYRDINDPPTLKSRFDISFGESFAGKTYTITNGTYTYTGTVPEELKVEVEVAGLETRYTISIGDSFTKTIDIGTYYINAKIIIDKYATNNLIFYYDAINNTGDGHDDSATTWADLSGNNNNGVITSGTWENNALIFDGSSTFVNCGRRDFTNVSVEAYIEYGIVPSGWTYIASNNYSGGYSIFGRNSKTAFSVVLNVVGQQYVYCTKNVVVGEPVHIIGTYDGIDIKLFINGVLNNMVNASDTITETGASTIFALGGHPSRETVTNEWFKGKIRSARMYDRALTEDEVYNNYIYELKRYS